jgi:hypothetical protein
MPRIRSVHPGLFTDEAFMTLTVERPLACTLLIGLWVQADDSGTFEWKPLTIKARVLPAVHEDVKDLLQALLDVDLIQLFDIGGKPYGVIRNFVKYQRPKDPQDIHPCSEQSRAFAGFEPDGSRPRSSTGRPRGETTSEPPPKPPGNPSEKSRQREEGGGNRRRKSSGSNEPELRASANSLVRFSDFWEKWKTTIADVGRKAAERAWGELACDEHADTIIAGIARYKANNPKDRILISAERFLRDERWRDNEPSNIVPVAMPHEFVPSGPPEWQAAMAGLRTDLGEAVFGSWVSRMELIGVENGVISVALPSKFLKSYVQQHYEGRVRGALAREFGDVDHVRFTIRDPPDGRLGHPDLATADENAA